MDRVDYFTHIILDSVSDSSDNVDPSFEQLLELYNDEEYVDMIYYEGLAMELNARNRE